MHILNEKIKLPVAHSHFEKTDFYWFWTKKITIFFLIPPFGIY